MNRRSFLSALAPSAAATALATTLPAPRWQYPVESETERGNKIEVAGVEFSDRMWNQYRNIHGHWWIYWTGWKHSFHQIELAGQWIACLHDAERPTRAAYSSWPGSFGFFFQGQMFDVSIQKHQGQAGYVNGLTSTENKIVYEAHALDTLLQLINMPEPIASQHWTSNDLWDSLDEQQKWQHSNLSSVQPRTVVSDRG